MRISFEKNRFWTTLGVASLISVLFSARSLPCGFGEAKQIELPPAAARAMTVFHMVDTSKLTCKKYRPARQELYNYFEGSNEIFIWPAQLRQ
jgi:hypothetical protein